MLWQRVVIGLAIAVVGSGLLSVLAYHGLVDLFGKRIGSIKYGRLTEHHYAVDPRARRRIRWGMAAFLIVTAACIFACAWSTVLSPEHFAEFFSTP
jgi:hypothetical protein